MCINLKSSKMKSLRLINVVLLFFISNAAISQFYGCPDPLANNFNPSVTNNDGSCIYNAASVATAVSFNLSDNLMETSGLISWNNQIWTHNDSDDSNIYALDSTNGSIVKSYLLSGIVNIDWEEISQDNDFVYLGDFGNNHNGNRVDLKILRINKSSILANAPTIEAINFSYPNQTSFTPAGSNNTDFDCEAFIVSTDSIFLFTKQWISNKTSVYSLSKSPGTHIATLKSTFDVQGLITGATYIASKKLIALSGYSKQLQPFVYLLYDFRGSDFFGGNKRKIQVSLPYHQVEGITTSNGLKYYISNEKFVQAPLINSPQKLHILDLSSFLEGYLNKFVSLPEVQSGKTDKVFPNPTKDFLNFKPENYRSADTYRIINQAGQTVLTGKMKIENPSINISDLSAGIYILMLENEKHFTFKVIKN